jgi:hypothetical protein
MRGKKGFAVQKVHSSGASRQPRMGNCICFDVRAMKTFEMGLMKGRAKSQSAHCLLFVHYVIKAP